MRAIRTRSERFREWQALRPEYAQLLHWLRMPGERIEEQVRRTEAAEEQRKVRNEP